MKKDYSKVHPQLRSFAKITPRLSFNKKNLGLVNFFMRFMPALKDHEGIDIENIFIPHLNEPTTLRLRMYKPEIMESPTPVLLWLHGGGYVMGRPEMDDWICSEYVRELGITVLSLDYHLAPRFPFPAALNDSYSALKWINSNSHRLNIDSHYIAIGGNSAGGGLAAALAQLVNDQGDIKVAFQLLVYPMLDDRTLLRTDIDDRQNITWDHKSNHFGWKSYLGAQCATEEVPAYAVPARRLDLSGLPPAWIGVGSLDIFHDEDVAYARKLKDCNVECELEIVPGAFHGFDVINPRLPVVQDFRKSQMAALKKYLGLRKQTRIN